MAPAVYWTFSPELQVPGWESPGSLSMPSLCITSEHSQDKGRPQAKEVRVRGRVEVLNWWLLLSRPISPCVPALNQITLTAGAGPWGWRGETTALFSKLIFIY